MKYDRGAFQTFVRGTVEASAAVLLAGIRLELGDEFVRPRGISLHPLPRRWLIDELVEEEELGKRTLEPGWLVAYADASSNAGRVKYNLACFYASLAWRDRQKVTRPELNELLEDSAGYLEAALARLAFRDLQVLVPWIDNDPSLRGLRELAPARFKQTTSPLSRVPAPKQRTPKARPWWRRLLARK